MTREGSLALSARHFYDIIRSLPGDSGDVTVKKLDNNWAEIICGSIEYRLLGMDAEEFQGLPDTSKAQLFAVDPAALKAMIDKTLFAVSPSTKPDTCSTARSLKSKAERDSAWWPPTGTGCHASIPSWPKTPREPGSRPA